MEKITKSTKKAEKANPEMGACFGFRCVIYFEPKSLRKEGRRDKRKRRKLERRKCGLDVAGVIREALEDLEVA